MGEAKQKLCKKSQRGHAFTILHLLCADPDRKTQLRNFANGTRRAGDSRTRLLMDIIAEKTEV
jgi:hypothetical protein